MNKIKLGFGVVSLACLLTLAGEIHGPSQAQAASPATPTAAARPLPATQNRERWHSLLLMGKKSGYLHSTTTTSGDRITTVSDLQIKMKREAMKIEVGMTTEFVETLAGKPISMTSTRKLSAIPTIERIEFGEGEATITTEQGGSRTTSKKTLPASPFLTPAAAERYMAEQQRAGAKVITATTLDPTDGLNFVVVTRTIGEPTMVQVMGKTVPAIKAKSTLDKYPGIVTEEFINDQGEVLKTIVNLGGIKMEQMLADRELALAEQDGPELLLSTLVKVDKPIKGARELRRAGYVLAVPAGELPDLPTSGWQRFERVGPTAGKVFIDMTTPGTLPSIEETTSDSLLASTTMLNWKDPAVDKMLREALPKEIVDEEARAESLRKFVRGAIKNKDMSVGFASASETARTMSGDCTEHAVLLAALLRGANIRSRVVSGLVYVPEFGDQKNVFGYHMWTQALVSARDGGRWIDLDAAIDQKHAFDATHIALGTSELADGQTQNYLVTMAPLIGRLIIKPIAEGAPTGK